MDLKLDQEVKATLCDGTVVDGVVTGLNEDCGNKVKVTVKYLTPAYAEVYSDQVQAK